MRKTFLSSMALVMALSSTLSLTACGGGRDTGGEKVDTTKTQLIISNYDGGGGHAWLDDIEARFEAAYAEKEYESGKKGVQILVDNHKTKGAEISFATDEADIFFNEEINYYDLPSSALDLTDVVEEILEQEGVSMTPEMQAGLQINGKYYALPHYEFYNGISYNKKVFNDEMLYIAADGSYTDADGDLAAGPDGQAGTDDDGLPATIEEFSALCAHMKLNEVTPFITSGANKMWYPTMAVDAFATAYDGADAAQAMMTFNGADLKVVTSMSDNRSEIITQTVQLKKENGNQAWQSAGRAYALTLIKEFADKGYFSSDGLVGTVQMTEAQKMFIESQAKNAPIAMIVDGSWWENEAAEFNVFDRVVEQRGDRYSRKNGEFAFMPLPTKLNDSDTNDVERGYFSTYNTFALAKKTVSEEKLELVKDFLKFCYSLENLQTYTQITGMAKGMVYEMPADKLTSMTTYQQSLWAVHKSGNVVYMLSDQDFVRSNLTSFLQQKRWETTAGGGSTSPFSFFDGHSDRTATSYFNGLKITQSKWNSSYLGL